MVAHQQPESPEVKEKQNQKEKKNFENQNLILP